MLDAVDKFAEHYQHFISAVEAFSTLLAVIVSLWLARQVGRTRFKALITKQVIIDPATSDRPEYLVAIITNTGSATLYIPLSFLLWTRPYRKKSGWLINFPVDYWGTDPAVPQKKYPSEILPKASQCIFISKIPDFRITMLSALKTQSWLGCLLFRFMRACVQVTDGTIIRAKISPEIRSELFEIKAAFTRSSAVEQPRE